MELELRSKSGKNLVSCMSQQSVLKVCGPGCGCGVRLPILAPLEPSQSDKSRWSALTRSAQTSLEWLLKTRMVFVCHKIDCGYVAQLRATVHAELSSWGGCGLLIVLIVPSGRTESGPASQECERPRRGCGCETLLLSWVLWGTSTILCKRTSLPSLL
jgi:hypothetical protein